MSMHLPTPDHPLDTPAQRAADRRRLVRALNASLAFVLLLVAVFAAQGQFDVAGWSVTPGALAGLLGLATAPVLHGSLEHLAANAISLLMLGTLAGAVYPRATLRALPLLWLGSGLGAWLLGAPGTSVTTVALNWGFDHFGRFAANYRQRFGEAPRETLQRARAQ